MNGIETNALDPSTNPLLDLQYHVIDHTRKEKKKVAYMNKYGHCDLS